MTPRSTPFGALALAAILLASASACGGPAESGATGTAPTEPGSTAPPATVVATAPPTTEASTTTVTEPPTTEPPTTEAPTTTAAPLPPPRPTRPLPPKAGRAQPPEALALPGPEIVPGEGLWTPIGPNVGGAPAIYATQLRTGIAGPGTASIAWIDTTAVSPRLFPGTQQPGGGFLTPNELPPSDHPSLVAAFNSGFLLAEAQGGFYLEGREAVPLRNGTAALAIDADGTAHVGMLGRDVGLGPSTAAIRQNLPLLVDGGAVAPSATDRDNVVWGKTLGGGPYVWRSGLGERADGTLVYVGGPAMSALALGNTLVAAGAVRAMELDINPQWVTFNTYAWNGSSLNAGKLRGDMTQPATRYLAPDSRDFIGLYARPGA